MSKFDLKKTNNSDSEKVLVATQSRRALVHASSAGMGTLSGLIETSRTRRSLARSAHSVLREVQKQQLEVHGDALLTQTKLDARRVKAQLVAEHAVVTDDLKANVAKLRNEADIQQGDIAMDNLIANKELAKLKKMEIDERVAAGTLEASDGEQAKALVDHLAHENAARGVERMESIRVNNKEEFDWMSEDMMKCQDYSV